MKWHRKTTSFGIWDDEGRRVAVVVQDHPSEALNSSLIAAAPQLLEALRIVSAECEMYGSPTHVGVFAMRRAISAATGPAPEPKE